MDPTTMLQTEVNQTRCGVILFPDEGFFVSMESTTGFEWVGWLDEFGRDVVLGGAWDSPLLASAEGEDVGVPGALESGMVPTPTGSTEDDSWSTGTTFPTIVTALVRRSYMWYHY